MLRNVGRAVIVKGGKDSSLDCALFNTYRRLKESSVEGEDTDPSCSYCKRHKETELHIYTQCNATQRFWNEAATWFRQNIDERLPRVIQDKPKIFGYWNERPDDNSNIFLRSARYTIFRG